MEYVILIALSLLIATILRKARAGDVRSSFMANTIENNERVSKGPRLSARV